ncbi:uncharacterized protein VTP21DRAFT_3393 [Calcarisporiella thermophila]|uniref:uncharacterized protein n=1 Tax=Calcarisporiella thermophila TaxID=911321 RepID=UPI0037441E25
MSRFVSRLGSSTEILQKYLTRRNVSDTGPVSQERYASILYSSVPSYGATDLSLQRSITFIESRLGGDTPSQFSQQRTDGKANGKLGTFDGVFVPTVLSIWGIIFFIRFGFVIGQAGILGTVFLFLAGYTIVILTTLSISAISTNGTVRGGGPYYMISRSLGPEFGGSIGLVCYLGNVINTSMNVLGFCEPLLSNFSVSSGTIARILPEGKWWEFLYGTILLFVSTLTCLAGSKFFARTSLILALLLVVSTFAIFLSLAIQQPFSDPERNIIYTGFNMETFWDNFWPKFTVAVGGKGDGTPETFQSVFGVLFPACIGILQGASMSGNLAQPSKSIPTGTLWAVGVTYIAYHVIILFMGACIGRITMYTDLMVLQDIALSPYLVVAGMYAAALFAVLSSLITSAKLLQAIARDNLLSFLFPFSQGTAKADEPIRGIFLTYLLSQLFLLNTNLNLMASFVTMTSLLTFAILNLACFLLKAASAPNFRPKFQYFEWHTAFAGMLLCIGAMYFVDPATATVSIVVTGLLFLWIHYSCPPKSWGDVTQSLIYHQVRKYLLRLDSRKESVKFWRPQILLLINSPRTSYKLTQLCNALKKGSLYILGHVIKGDFREQFGELSRQNHAWLRFVDVTKIKAFVQLNIAANEREGARNLVLDSGLGGMRPNVVVLGFFNLQKYHASKQRQELDADPTSASQDAPGSLPTDGDRVETPISITNWCGIIEDVLLLNKAVAVAYNFQALEMPVPTRHPRWHNLRGAIQAAMYSENGVRKKQFIDLWPIQMTAPVLPQGSSSGAPGEESIPALLSNFNTYTMILNLGTILHTVPTWRAHFKLRIMCFVEYESDTEEEKRRVQLLLDNLRIPGELIVLSLDNVRVRAYESICRGKPAPLAVEEALKGISWWENLKQTREKAKAQPTPGPFNSSSVHPKAASSLKMTGPAGREGGEGAHEGEEVSGEEYPMSLSSSPERMIAQLPGNSLPSYLRLSMSINMPLPDPTLVIDESSSGDETEHEEESVMGEHEARTGEYLERLKRCASMSSAPCDHSSITLDIPEERPARQRRCSAMPDQPIHSVTFASPPIPAHRERTRQFSPELRERAARSRTLSGGDRENPNALRTQFEFNELPARAQHLILNDIMRLHSDDTALILTTLPAPEPDTSQSEEASLEYVENLDILVKGLPTTLLIHGKSLTVTMAL